MREKDPRLQNHDGFYDVYRDSENIRVAPENRIKPASTKEQVTVNKVMKGEIKGGYFKGPCLEFYNSKHDMALFDKVCFSTFREELPEDPDINYPDLGIERILVKYNTVLQTTEGTLAIGRARGVTEMYLFDNHYQSEDIAVTLWNDTTALVGTIYLTTNPDAGLWLGKSSSYGLRLSSYLPENINTPIYVIVRDLKMRHSLTTKNLLYINEEYNSILTDYTTLDVLGGGR